MESMPYRKSVAMTIQIHNNFPLDDPSKVFRKLKAAKVPSVRLGTSVSTLPLKYMTRGVKRSTALTAIAVAPRQQQSK